MREMHHLVQPLTEEFAEAALTDPFRALKMSAVDSRCPIGFSAGIEAEEYLDHLFPVGTLRVGVEQPQV